MSDECTHPPGALGYACLYCFDEARSHLETATAENERLLRERVVPAEAHARGCERDADIAEERLETARKALEVLLREAQSHYEDDRCGLFDGGLNDALFAGRAALRALDTPAATPEAKSCVCQVKGPKQCPACSPSRSSK